jgi:hypothetical protein
VCAYLPGGEPNLVVDDIAGHLTLEHRSGSRDLITFLDESTSNRHGVRRITHSTRGVSASRPRRYRLLYNHYYTSVEKLYFNIFGMYYYRLYRNLFLYILCIENIFKFNFIYLLSFLLKIILLNCIL